MHTDAIGQLPCARRCGISVNSTTLEKRQGRQPPDMLHVIIQEEQQEEVEEDGNHHRSLGTGSSHEVRSNHQLGCDRTSAAGDVAASKATWCR